MTALTVYIDFKSPAAYLALNPLLDLLRRHGMTACWYPLDCRQERIPARQPAETRGETHRRVRAAARRRTHQRYAAVQGLPLHFRDDPGSTRLALAALAQLDRDSLGFIRAAFDAYWVDGADLDDPAVVEPLWQDSTSGDAFDPEAGAARLDRLREEARRHGVYDVPAMLLGDQVFIGREHLPWLEAAFKGEL